MQSANRQGHDYEMPPALINALARGRTWALWCEACPREIIVDIIRLLERHEPYDAVSFDRAVCKVCGAGLKRTGGYVLSALQFRGKMPRLITTDGSDFHQHASRR